ncbi:MAG: ATP-grasp domain-containing protein [Planctomycetota bacterium]|nr:ATP-grasp domain-containing protein [Planctomycetota bacterium]MDA1141001.1 ATP-grasp domain-containing protein [Planctomycetota bacterium]
MDKIFVAVSGINAVDNPGPGVAVARSLKEDEGLGVQVAGLAYDAMEPGVYMDWVVDRSFVMPYPSGKGQDYIDRLLYIKDSFGLDFVIPNLDAELPLYIKYADQLDKAGIKTFLPTKEQFRLRGKDRLVEVAEKIRIRVPETRAVHSVDALVEAIGEIELPVMVKGSYYQAYRAYTTQEAVGYYNKLVAEWGYPIIVQQVVTGDELNVVGVGDGDGELLGMVGMKKMWITSQGKVWTGVTVKNERMLDAAASLVHEFKWRGPFELECIVSGEDVFLIEINPRFPAWCYLATGVGLNLPARIVRRALGLPYEIGTDYEAGKLFVRYTYELVTSMDRLQAATTRGESP